MAILAQEWLEQHDPTRWDFWLEQRLVMPAVKAPHSVAALADRIVVQEDATDLMYEMAANNQIDLQDMFRHTRLPSEAVWIEWRDKHVNLEIGVLLDSRCKAPALTSDPVIGVLVVVRSRKSTRSQIMFCGTAKCLPFDGTSLNDQSTLAWGYFDEMKKDPKYAEMNEDGNKEFARSLSTAVFTLFVMQHPKLIEREPVLQPSAIQKKRAQHRKPPLLDYSRVYIKINKNIPAKVRAGMVKGRDARGTPLPVNEHGPKKKYHKVLGHFRTYNRGESNEVIKWINEHWRGDPSLGVVLHEHRVTKG